MAREADLKELVEAELESSGERLEAAKLLLSKNKLPDAVNRIYYAAFHAARAVLNSMGKDPKTHSGLLSEFSLWVVKQGVMGKADFSALRKSFEARETSDYTIASVFEGKEVRELYAEVEVFMSKASKVARKKVKGFS